VGIRMSTIHVAIAVTASEIEIARIQSTARNLRRILG
jgi:hypothetical protein